MRVPPRIYPRRPKGKRAVKPTLSPDQLRAHYINIWRAAHPDASEAERQAAFERIARECGA